ncbi:hypothetical protein OCC_09521 [Thermococcus litoralis DSM 5473]|uniref:Uncharacterized protein n=1 Tax=Thermococcus litoralis (strain ATCC 51850 / DSM 5473 / JCM 8560 / NS-C) TaxID=523849 RepID=H3ZQS9_THELN|nr:hypothetical protein [Thermococcus litoralis]EHR77655.1 hypothetical protein OCC_09521 [Thermococcus litoralis DSM 5473]KUK00054.1 MAG: Uncharacterized protein XD43_0282 [Thermococcales archaeon 44_46]HIH73435.1 hypothetical protein [Thermococcaceae archaeon]
MKFKGKAFGNLVRIEFEILSLSELKIEDLKDFDIENLKIELKPTSSGIKIVGIWEGEVEKAGEGIKKALEESYKLRDKILNRMKAKIERIRGVMKKLGFTEEVLGYGNLIKFTKKIGDYEIAVVASSKDDLIRVEVYGNDKKVIGPEIENFFEDVDVEELEVYGLDEEAQEERLVINLELPEEEVPETKIVEAIKLIESLLMT